MSTSYSLDNINADNISLEKGISEIMKGKVLITYEVLEGGFIPTSYKYYYDRINNKFYIQKGTNTHGCSETDLIKFLNNWCLEGFIYGEFIDTPDSKLFELNKSSKIKFDNNESELIFYPSGITLKFHDKGNFFSISVSKQQSFNQFYINMDKIREIGVSAQKIMKEYGNFSHFLIAGGI